MHRALGLTLLLAASASAQTHFPLGDWTLNPGAERSQVIATGETLGAGRFRVALLSHGLAAPTDSLVITNVLQLREHLAAAVGLGSRFQLSAQVPVMVLQSPSHTPGQAVGRPWVSGRFGLLAPSMDDSLWLAIELGVGIPGLGQAELTPATDVLGSLRVSLGFPWSRGGVIGFEAELRAALTRVDLRAGGTLVSAGIHLKGELSLRGDVSLSNPHGFIELLGGVRYVLRPVELSLLTGPGYGLANTGLSYRLVLGLGFLSPGSDEGVPITPPRPDCTEGTPYVLEACPDLDFDNDGVLNRVDRCPREFGPKENDGCPWPDSDGDGVLDAIDNCPKVPGPPENQGCPKERKQLVVIKTEKLEILDKVYFEFDKAIIKPESFELLDQVAAVINGHPELARIRIEGHTDRVGSAEYNRRLSQDRARAVKTYLVERGNVAGTRLSIAGYGFDRPIDTNDTDEGRAKNRRVEFMIIKPGIVLEPPLEDSEP